jgi:hypothetical protein
LLKYLGTPFGPASGPWPDHRIANRKGRVIASFEG